MNAWQALRQLRYRLRARAWPDGAAERVLRSVHITAGPTEEAYGELYPPFVLLAPGAAETDPEEPGLVRQEIQATLVVAVEGDAVGDRALLGGARSGGPGSSLGRGLLELEEEVLAAIGELDQTTGVRLRVTHRSSPEVGLVEGLGYVAARAYTLEGWLTAARYYHPPLRLTAADAGAGQANVSWALPPDRFDRRRMVLRRAAGAVAPATAVAGVNVVVGAMATAVVDAPGVGQFSYAIFAAYNETWSEEDSAATASAADERFSAQELGTTATVTVT